jgi:hypothetical protein
MNSWKEIEKINEIVANWNRKGRSCYVGFEPGYIDEDQVHKNQVIQPSGGKFSQNQRVLESGDVEVIIPKTEDFQSTMELYENNYLHDVEFNCFIGASVTKTELVKKVIGRIGNGKTYGEVPVEKKVPGYLYAVVRIKEVIDLGDSVKFVYGPAAA